MAIPSDGDHRENAYVSTVILQLNPVFSKKINEIILHEILWRFWQYKEISGVDYPFNKYVSIADLLYSTINRSTVLNECGNMYIVQSSKFLVTYTCTAVQNYKALYCNGIHYTNIKILATPNKMYVSCEEVFNDNQM